MTKKKNHKLTVTFSKYLLFLKENKLYVIAFILLLLTVKLKIGWFNNNFNFAIECNPISIVEVKEIIK